MSEEMKMVSKTSWKLNSAQAKGQAKLPVPKQTNVPNSAQKLKQSKQDEKIR
jgi:hypothetical protein